MDSENGYSFSDPNTKTNPKARATHATTLDLGCDRDSVVDYLKSFQLRSGTYEEPMDEVLWSNLPDHLFDAILACLPITSILKMRSVCKKWNWIISSAAFLQVCSRLSPRRPFFLMFADHFRHKVGAAYDVELNKWHIIPLSNFLQCQPLDSFNVLATDGGLFCLEGTGIQSGSIFVSNPMTRYQRKLPPMLFMKSPYVVGMVVDRYGEGYKILVAQDGDCLLSQVYDSKSNAWKMTGTLQRRTALVSGAAFHKGLLYCITFGPDGVLAFDLEHGTWHESNPVMPSFLTCPQLLENRGELMMIGGIEEFGALKGVHFWRWIPGTQYWLEVKRVPETLFKRFFNSSSGHFLCVAHSDQVCFHDYHYPHVLMYNFVRDAWSWLPSCSLTRDMEAQSVLGFAFEPRLDASV
ncbi:hypothetical protein O6H91_09G062300 [Diphasiastrum complanatum]|nr:hypothetical protein O6H91_09G062300 [Diphasiastrum complanatum]